MESIKAAIDGSCIDYLDVNKSLDDKQRIADNIKVLAASYKIVADADTERDRIKLDAEKHEAEKAVNAAKDQFEKDKLAQEKELALAKIETEKAANAAKEKFDTNKLAQEKELETAKIEADKQISMAKLVFENDQHAEEMAEKEADREARSKEKLRDNVITVCTAITTGGCTLAGLLFHRQELVDILKFESDDKIPVSVAFQLFSRRK